MYRYIAIYICLMLFVSACTDSTNQGVNKSSLSKNIVEITGEGVVSPGTYEFREGMVVSDLVNLAAVSYTHLTLPTTPYV